MDETCTAVYTCPKCGGQLERNARGDLHCCECSEDFGVLEGMPDLTFPKNLMGQTLKDRDYWNDFAGEYDRKMDQMFGRFEASFRRFLVSKLEAHTGGSVLEVAIGTGRNLAALKEQVGTQALVYGLDLSASMLRRCRERAVDAGLTVDLCVANAEYLPYPDNTFDAVLHFGFINDFSDPGRAIREIVRVLKPGGRAVISDDSVPPASRSSALTSRLMVNNKSFEGLPPTNLLPVEAQPYHLCWWMGFFYVLTFNKAK